MNKNERVKTAEVVVGVDIGGSHITAGLVNVGDCTVNQGSIVRVAVDPHAPAHNIIKAWGDVIRQVAVSFENAAENATFKIGIAMPGPFDYENGISLIKGFNKYEALHGLNVKEMLAHDIGISTAAILLKNDAAAFLQGEIYCGAATGYQQAIGITMGTGLGSARTVNGNTEACEVNVSPLHQGIAEDYISIRWFLKRYRELTGQAVKDVKFLAEAARHEASAAQVFREFTANLATVLQRFMAEEQPDIVVIGGGIANAYDLFYPQLIELLQDTMEKTLIKRSLLGETAAIAGAACCWKSEQIDTLPEQNNQQTINRYL